MKKTAVLMSLAFVAGTVIAEDIVFEDDFNSYTGGTIHGSDWRPKWDTNSVPLQADLLTATNGVATLDTSNATQNYHAPTTHGFTVTDDETMVIKSDMRFVHAPGGAPDIKNKSFFTLNISTTSNSWDGVTKDKAVVMRNKAIGFAHDGTDGVWVEGWKNVSELGVNADLGGTSDWVVVQSELSVSNGTIWMDMDLYGEYSAGLIIDGTPRDTGIAAGTTIYAGISSGYNGSSSNTVEEITQISAVDIDNFYVGTPPLDTIVWADNFDDQADYSSVQYRGTWELFGNNNKWMGYNGYAMQRPNFDTNNATGSGWGGVMNETAVQPEAGEAAVFEFDWRVFTGEANNNDMLDLAVMGELWTNGVWGDRPQGSYESDNTAMGFRIYQKGSGGWRIYYAETNNAITVLDFDDSVLGIDPAAGDHTSDTIRVTYSIEKTEVQDTLFVDLTLYNAASNKTLSIPDIKVVNADLYNQESFYFMSAGQNGYGVGSEGNEFDNIYGIIRSFEPLGEGVIIDENFDGFVSGDPLDSDGEWEPLNATGGHFDIDDGMATCWPSEDLGINWRGEMNTWSTITGIEKGDTIEISYDEKIYGRDALNTTMLDVILSSVYTNAGTSYNDENAIGIRVAKKATGDYRIDTYEGSPGGDDFSTSLTNLGSVAADGTTTTEWHRVTYSLTKSETADTWTVDLTVSNLVSGWSDSLSDVDVVQANTYNASELFFGFYGASNYGNTNGISVDNLLVKHIVPPLVGYDEWYADHNLTLGPDGDDDSDGLANWGEWMLDGDPKDDTDLGELASISGTDVSILLRNDNTARYALASTDNLVTDNWTTGTWVNITANDFLMSEVVETAPDGDSVFVKVVVEPQP